MNNKLGKHIESIGSINADVTVDNTTQANAGRNLGRISNLSSALNSAINSRAHVNNNHEKIYRSIENLTVGVSNSVDKQDYFNQIKRDAQAHTNNKHRISNSFSSSFMPFAFNSQENIPTTTPNRLRTNVYQPMSEAIAKGIFAQDSGSPHNVREVPTFLDANTSELKNKSSMNGLHNMSRPFITANLASQESILTQTSPVMMQMKTKNNWRPTGGN